VIALVGPAGCGDSAYHRTQRQQAFNALPPDRSPFADSGDGRCAPRSQMLGRLHLDEQPPIGEHHPSPG